MDPSRRSRCETLPTSIPQLAPSSFTREMGQLRPMAYRLTASRPPKALALKHFPGCGNAVDGAASPDGSIKSMSAEVGQFALILAFVISLVQAASPLLGAHRGDPVLMALGRAAALLQAGFVALAF